MKLTNVDIARVVYEVNRAYCAALGDMSQPAWEDAADWQKDSVTMGVLFHIKHPDAGAESSHESWRALKVADGWVYGPVKAPDLKRHPCIVPFNMLPREQQAKDFLFCAVVHSMSSIDVTTAT